MMYENFDRDYLDLPNFVEKRRTRDELLRNGGIDPDEFREWLRMRDVLNETDTDEYRETQPSKGLGFITDFLADFAPGLAACRHMLQLTLKWLNVVNEANMAAYAGADELEPILNICFDFLWEQGRVGLYYDELDDSLIAQWKEDGGS